MQLELAYDKLEGLDMEEQIGYAYFQKTGQYLDYMYLSYLKTLDDPYDFGALESEEAQTYRQDMLQQLDKRLSGMLREQLFIEAGTNTEIQHLPRYIDIFMHRHDFFEIVCTVKGKCKHTVEDKTTWMQAGDITVIPPNVRHHLLGQSNCITFTVKTRKTTFDSVFSVLMRSGTTLSAYFAKTLYSKHYRNSLTFHCGQDAFLPELLFYMYAQQNEKKPHYNYVLDGLLATFFPYLVQNYEDTIEFADGDNAQNERMIEIESYMRQNYKTATLTDAAHRFYLSPAYLSTMIKKQTGYTFSAILYRIRMENAAELLQNTNLKVEQICENVGYNDTTQFIKSFKRQYGMTPLRFRNTFGTDVSNK